MRSIDNVRISRFLKRAFSRWICHNTHAGPLLICMQVVEQIESKTELVVDWFVVNQQPNVSFCQLLERLCVASVHEKQKRFNCCPTWKFCVIFLYVFYWLAGG